jgi:hypothetical protein
MKNAVAETEQGMHRIARFIFRVMISLTLIACFLEGALRFGLGLGNPVLITPDAACSYILKPDQDVRRFFARTHTNHYGMRSDEIPSVKKAGVLRLMFVGDSITYGTSRVDQDKLFTELIHRDLPAIVHRPVEVLNASAGAWAPDNELSYIRSRGIFQSDIVLLVLNDGDLTQPRNTIAAVGDDLPQKRPATAIGELIARYIRPRIGQFLGKSDAGDRIVANSDDVIHRNLEDLDSFDELVKSQGARLILVYIPFRRDIPELSRSSASILTAWCGARHVGIFDLTSAEAPYSAKKITLDNGVHLNAMGHGVIAQALERSWLVVTGKWEPMD